MKKELCGIALGVLVGYGMKIYFDNKSEINRCFKKMVRTNEETLNELKNTVKCGCE